MSVRAFQVLFGSSPLGSPLGCRALGVGISLEEFVQDHDYRIYGPSRTVTPEASSSSSLQSLVDLISLRVVNAFDAQSSLHAYLDELDLLNPERLRPGWDTYFMQLATLASQRSNCMKRRVGAILVRNKRILATGCARFTSPWLLDVH